MLTMREAGPEGFGKKVREWNRTEVLVGWRERWAELANERLIELGHDIRIDHRSYAAQGIGLEPQNKIGPAGARREARGEEAERAAEHVALARRNGERIIAEPELVLDALTRQQSTFTRRDLARMVDRHTADGDQFAAAMAKVEASPELVRLGADERGAGSVDHADDAGDRAADGADRGRRWPSGRRIGSICAGGWQSRRTLGAEQVLAFRHVTQAQDLSVVVGYAGTGKSTMLGEARAAWEAEGYRVRGAALSGIAAEQLEAGAGITSRTVHSLLFQWARGKEALSSRDVLVVDEAGMIGSRQMERLLAHAQAAGPRWCWWAIPSSCRRSRRGRRSGRSPSGWARWRSPRCGGSAWRGSRQATRALATGRTAAGAGAVRGRRDGAGARHARRRPRRR